MKTLSSRRALLAGAPAAAVAMATGTAVAAVTPDPIFDLIDLHRRTWRAYTQAYEAFLKLDNNHKRPERGIVLGERPVWTFEDVKNGGNGSDGNFALDLLSRRTDEVPLRRVMTGEMEPVIARRDADIEGNAKHFAPKGEEQTWIAQKEAELESHEDEVDAAEALTPRSRAYDRWNDTSDLLVELTGRLARTEPVKMRGLAAILAYWAEFNEDIWDETDLGKEERWEVLAQAATKLA